MDVVENREYLHIERRQNPEWLPGKSFFIGGSLNPFIKEFEAGRFLRELAPTDPYSVSYMLEDFVKASDGQAKDPNIDWYNGYDSTSLIREASVVLSHYLNLLREYIFEEVRKSHFPELPSRQRGLRLIEDDIASVRAWQGILGGGRVFRVKTSGKVQKLYEGWLHVGSWSMDEFRQRAYRYWAGLPHSGRRSWVFRQEDRHNDR